MPDQKTGVQSIRKSLTDGNVPETMVEFTMQRRQQQLETSNALHLTAKVSMQILGVMVKKAEAGDLDPRTARIMLDMVKASLGKYAKEEKQWTGSPLRQAWEQLMTELEQHPEIRTLALNILRNYQAPAKR